MLDILGLWSLFEEMFIIIIMFIVPVVSTSLILQWWLHGAVDGRLSSLDWVFGERADHLHDELLRAIQVTP